MYVHSLPLEPEVPLGVSLKSLSQLLFLCLPVCVIIFHLALSND